MLSVVFPACGHVVEKWCKCNKATNKQNNWEHFFVVVILKVTDENTRIGAGVGSGSRSVSERYGSGSKTKCRGSATLFIDIGVLLKQAKYRYLAKAVCRLPRRRPRRGSRRCCAGPAAALRGSGCGSPPHALQTLTKIEALDVSVADPDPGSGAFLTPGSGIRDG